MEQEVDARHVERCVERTERTMESRSGSRQLMAMMVITAVMALSEPTPAFTQSGDVRLNVVGELDSPIGRLRMVGEILYTAGGGFMVIDASDPTLPQVIGRSNLPDRPRFANDLVVVEDTAYVAGRGLEVVDLSDRAHPRSVGSFETRDSTFGIVVVGQHALLGEPTGHAVGGLRVLDVSNASAPAEVTFLDTPGGIHELVQHGSLLYARDIRSGEAGWLHQILIIDVANPASPRIVGAIPAPGGPRRHMVVAHDRLFLDGRVFDLSDPGHPREVGTYADLEHAEDRAESLAVSDEWIVMAAVSEVVLFRRDDPHTMVASARFPFPDYFAYHVYVEGDRVYVVTGEDYPPHLWVLQIRHGEERHPVYLPMALHAHAAVRP